MTLDLYVHMDLVGSCSNYSNPIDLGKGLKLCISHFPGGADVVGPRITC